MGSYGIVCKGRWKGEEVAVKRFIRQKLDERRMLELRAEIALLSGLRHPNIVQLIGNLVHLPTHHLHMMMRIQYLPPSCSLLSTQSLCQAFCPTIHLSARCFTYTHTHSCCSTEIYLLVFCAGACIHRPDLCIVTEYMSRGSLNDVLYNNRSLIRLTWKLRLTMLYSAALGMDFLHSNSPTIVHRSLKPSNLLVCIRSSATHSY